MVSSFYALVHRKYKYLQYLKSPIDHTLYPIIFCNLQMHYQQLQSYTL